MNHRINDLFATKIKEYFHLCTHGVKLRKIFLEFNPRIVNILTENKTIDKKNLTAAGRGEYAPLASNDNAEGKAKNRRIEIILTPKLDEISKMLEDLN